MEKEYRFKRNQQISHDFQATAVLMIIINIAAAVPAFIDDNKTDMAISSSLIGLLVLLLLMERCLKRYVQYLAILVIFAFIISRFFMLQHNYATTSKTSMFFTGYALASLQIIMFTRIPQLEFQIVGIIAAYAIKFGFMFGVVNPDGRPNWLTFFRQFTTDIFIVYIFYSSEKADRKVFQNFYENREELLKFKELIADTLPLSITIMNTRSNKFLFSNKHFQSTFEPPSASGGDPDSPRMLVFTTEGNSANNVKPQLESLIVDQTTVRELGTLNPTMNSSPNGSSAAYLRNIIQELVQDNVLSNRPLSLTTFCSHQDQKRFFEVILKRIRWDGMDAVAIIINDITYQENLTALRVSNTNKDRVIATVSHELRTPLNGILGLLNIVEKKVNNVEVEEYISLCKDNANLLLSLVNSILDLQQVAAGKLKLNTARIEIRKVLLDIVKLFQFQCSQKGIYIRFNIHTKVPDYINTDVNRLKQILINLISNAIKFTSKGGIKIEVSPGLENPDSLLISVVDTGVGIKEEDKKKLFKMYGKLDDNSNMNKNGVGLGLTISNVLAAVLNGKADNRGIEVESEYGFGSKFYFEIQKNLSKHDLDLKRFSIQENGRNLSTNNTKFQDSAGLYRDINSERDPISELEEENLGSSCQEELVMPVELELKLASYISLKKFTTEDLNSYSKVYKLSMGRDINPYDIKRGSIQDGEDQFESRVLDTRRVNQEEEEDYEKLDLQEHQICTAEALTKGCILVVDDNPFNLLVADNLIKDFGYTTKVAMGGQEAIDILKTAAREYQPIKAIILDCQMPIMDGYETAKTLRSMMEQKEIPYVPILGWTANNSQEDIKRCFDSGMIDYLPKPASQTTILKAFAKLE